VPDDLVSVADEGFEKQADWQRLGSPETYLGYQQAQGFASPGPEFDEPRTYALPDQLELNQWALAGNWTVGPGASELNEADGRLAFRFHARDVNLVMGPSPGGASVPFRVSVDGELPGDAHGLDVDEDGNGTLDRPRLHQLIRQSGAIADRTFEISFGAPGAEAYCFTFG
jgi:Thioredoxin like C-terminal domain